MKNLIYKEFKLAVHPLIFVLFGLITLYTFLSVFPGALSYMVLLAAYSILFLGANKGQQSNDLLYSVLLPIRKKDVVKARMATITIFAALTFVITLIGALIFDRYGFILEMDSDTSTFGYGLDTFLISSGLGLLGLGIANVIYLPLYYRNGKSIVMPTIFSLLFFSIYSSSLLILLPKKGIFDGITNSISSQAILFGICFAAFVGLQFACYFISAKLIEKVDF